jgi:hypothetical protein
MFARPLQLRLGIVKNHLARRSYSKMESSNNPLAGLWRPNPLKGKPLGLSLISQDLMPY